MRPIFYQEFARIVRTDRGDLSYLILGQNKAFEDVAYVDYIQADTSNGEEFIRKTREAFGNEFSSRLYAKDFLSQKIESGELRPKDIWKEIKREYKISSDFDFKN